MSYAGGHSCSHNAALGIECEHDRGVTVPARLVPVLWWMSVTAWLCGGPVLAALVSPVVLMRPPRP